MKSWPFKLLSVVLFTVLLLAVFEGLASFYWLGRDYALFVAQLPRAISFKEDFHAQHDPDIGWVHIPGKVIRDLYGPGKNLTINRQGVRGLKEYDGANDLVILGDSFTLGYGVDDMATYPAQLQRMANQVNIVNMGQGGYSVGQCYLWFKRDGARQFKPKIVVFAIIVDDIWRMASTRTANGYATPRFDLKNHRVTVSGPPLPGKIPQGETITDRVRKARFIVEHSALLRLFEKMTPGAPLNREALIALAETMIGDLADEQNLVLVLLPEWTDLTDPAQFKAYQEVSVRFARFAAGRDLPYLDLMPAFLQVGPQAGHDFFLDEHWRHYSEAGNEFVARRLYDFLLRQAESPLKSAP